MKRLEEIVQYIITFIIGVTLLVLMNSCEQEDVCYKSADFSYEIGGEPHFSANVPCYLSVGDKFGNGYLVNERD